VKNIHNQNFSIKYCVAFITQKLSFSLLYTVQLLQHDFCYFSAASILWNSRKQNILFRKQTCSFFYLRWAVNRWSLPWNV